MNDYIIRQIQPIEYEAIRKLDRDAFEYNERGSDGYWHEVFGNNIHRSPHYIPELELVAVTDDGVYLGHAIFSTLPIGDGGSISFGSTALRSNTEKRITIPKKFMNISEKA
jgi:predicted N-acetyltransferase YhbS